MSMSKQLSYENDVEDIKGIQFCVMGPDEILAQSVAEINNSNTYNGTEGVYNGRFDPRMGVIEHSKTCVTCHQSNAFCQGHFGHIVLAKPMYYVQFFNIVQKLLGCVCYRCSKLLVDPENDKIKAILSKKISRQKRWDLMSKECKSVKSCGAVSPFGCGAEKPTITKEGVLKIVMEWKDAKNPANTRRISLDAAQARLILRRITDADAMCLGFHPRFNRPEWMICTVMPVPPIAVRPSIRNDAGQRSEDDLTHTLANIIKFNVALKEKMMNPSAPTQSVEMQAMLLQYEIATFIDNTKKGIPQAQQRNGRANRSLIERLKSKEGRIRGNLMGKRVDFSARSVISPDPNISIDEVGVPFKIAMNLTFPEVANKYNIDELRRLVANGPNRYPGAKLVRQNAPVHKVMILEDDTRCAKIATELKEGDIVDRHLRDGDVVLFNRQPSLHKMSMLAHRVRVMTDNTFRLNVCVTGGYNADFDGDEMNMHVPQSSQTAEELMDLASVKQHIISPSECKPIVSIVQDICLGVFRLTKEDVRLTEKEMFNLTSTASNFAGYLPLPEFPAVVEGGIVVKPALWTGRQLLSTIIPEKVNLNYKNGYNDNKTPYENRNAIVKIESGRIVSGTFDKSVYQSGTRGLVHTILNEYGADRTRDFFDDTQRLICNWLVGSGFSVGISDLMIEAATTEQFSEVIDGMKKQVYERIADARRGVLKNTENKSNHDFFEFTVNNLLNGATRDVGSMGTQKIDESINRMINMIKSGSKGSPTNVSRMIGCLGQQNVEGKRIPYSFDQRTLPHYKKYDDGPESRGFVESSFIKGLSPQEFFFHAMGGREGLIDTAVQSVTWETPIIIVEDGLCKYVRIGEWIDAHLESAYGKAEVSNFPQDRNMEFLQLPKNVVIPTADADGNVTWGEMTAVTRHDPGERLFKIRTMGGREVIVADSKSVLVWRADENGVESFMETESKDLKIGDRMPVTMHLPEPPVVVRSIDMAEFLPKEEHVYGTDFNRAIVMMKEAQGEKFHIPRGWWKANNGKTFTLPYVKKASLTRVNSGRSNVENVRDGFVYPYHASRCCGGVPERFELNKVNGTFIGLYLADGHSHEESGCVGVSKNDPVVREWVKKWFDSYGITNSVQDNSNERGDSFTIRGFSMLLVRFLDQFVGHGAENKHVPDVAFVAPEEFIIGLVSGYISGDGSIGRNAITSCSVSQQLSEGIAMLCARLGAFAKMTVQPSTKGFKTIHNLAIRAQWAQVLVDKLDLIHPDKAKAFAEMRCTTSHCNYTAHNDVVFDPVASIENIGVDGYPKLYDVTVPSTLNFCLSNGQMVRDTSDTGYIQRKLVKAMEDCKVGHDYSVRNASGAIVQFLYGEDGMDPSKIESHDIPYIDKHGAYMPAAFDNAYKFMDKTLSELRGVLDDATFAATLASRDTWKNEMTAHVKQLRKDKEYLTESIFTPTFMSQSRSGPTVMYPVSFKRIINNTLGIYKKFESSLPGRSDLDPAHVLKALASMERDLYVNKVHRGTQLFNILARAYLSPKVAIIERRLSRDAFDYIIATVRAQFVKSLVVPSDMVGVVAATSLGQISTQSTLNSVVYDTEILLRFKDGVSSVERFQIGEFVEGAISSTQGSPWSARLEKHPKDTTLAWLKDGGDEGAVASGVEVLSCDEEGRVVWKEVTAVTRHPVINEDGTDTLLHVTTLRGRSVIATKGQSFLKRQDNKILPINGADLKVGDHLPVSKVLPLLTGEEPLMYLDTGYLDVVAQYIDVGPIRCLYLDDIFGFFVGCFMNDEVTKIYDDRFEFDLRVQHRATITTLCERYGMSWSVEGKDDGVRMVVHSPLFHRFMTTTFGEARRLPAKMLFADLRFLAGVVEGFTITSRPGDLMGDIGRLEDMRQVFVRFGFVLDIRDGELVIPGDVAAVFAISGIDERLRWIRKVQATYAKTDIIPDVIFPVNDDARDAYGSKVESLSILRADIDHLLGLIPSSASFSADRDILKRLAQEDIVYDRIVSIVEVPNPTAYVYDLTVRDTRNFNTYTGLAMRDTFHGAGIASASKSVRGVPRLKEILSVTAKIKTPIMQIHFNDGEITDQHSGVAAMNAIRTVRFRDIVNKASIYFDKSDEETVIESDRGFLSTYDEDESVDSPWLLRLELDPKSMLDYEVTMDMLHFVILGFDADLVWKYSDDNTKPLVFRMRFKVKEAAAEVQDMLVNLKALQHTILDHVVIKGTKQIEKVAFTYDMYGTQKKYVVYTIGTNLAAVLGNPRVDGRLTITNDIVEVFNVLGVEAGRVAIFNEIMNVFDTAYINSRHISLLADVMTNRGTLMSVSRFGISRSDIGPLAKASFEEIENKLTMAGVFGELDRMTGVSANVMIGAITPCGTGDVEVMMDEEMMQDPFVDGDVADECVFSFKTAMVTAGSRVVRKKEDNEATIV